MGWGSGQVEGTSQLYGFIDLSKGLEVGPGRARQGNRKWFSVPVLNGILEVMRLERCLASQIWT